ncbi:MAG: hypothetical protein U5J95_09210 [Balneolaceae bacterium]|nr:hypothetical protein [Balneolaceae bacterium]
MRLTKPLLLLAMIFLFGNANQLYAQHNNSPKIIAVFNHADWCKGCQIMKPKLKAIKPQFKDRKVLFTGFEKTNKFTKYQSAMLAEQLGLSKLYQKYKGKTAFVVLIDAKTKEELGILTFKESKEELKKAIVQALNTK